MEGVELKRTLWKACSDLVGDKIAALQESNKEAQEAANNETKSSAGDKYETGRAMAHLEKERIASQLAELAKLQKTLSQIKMEKEDLEVKIGSVVITPQMKYYISVGLGKINIGDQSFFCISPVAPIGKLLMGKKAGDKINFQGRELTLEKVF